MEQIGTEVMCVQVMKTYIMGLDEEETPNEITMGFRADRKLEGHINTIVEMLEESLPMVSITKVLDNMW